uniref:Uncharacterized protein n=1 Tax=Glossina brevipalpis TaxID=37001 RepID=A0A1A9W0B5_9MUSC
MFISSLTDNRSNTLDICIEVYAARSLEQSIQIYPRIAFGSCLTYNITSVILFLLLKENKAKFIGPLELELIPNTEYEYYLTSQAGTSCSVDLSAIEANEIKS